MEATGKAEKEVTSRIEKAGTVYQQSEQRHQDEGFSHTSDVSTTVWC